MGWLKGQAWCAYTGKAIWYNAFLVDDPAGAKLILKYATGSALGTYNAFKKSKEFHVQAAPTLGALVIYIEGDGPFGHEGVVTWVHPTLESFKFVSGNTSKAGSREGTTVLEKIDYTHGPRPARGLKILGFVSPIRIAQE